MNTIQALSDNKTDPLRGKRYHTKMELVNVALRQGSDHKFGWDFETLEFALKRYGFATVKHQSYGTSAMPELCTDQEYRAPQSLYVEAIK